MPTSLLQYEMLPTTWFYLSSLMIIAIFFKFNRFWSIRNLDILGLILMTPGFLFISMNRDKLGYTWIYVIGFVLVIRLLFDLFMVRRPLLEPNLNPSGMTFACVLILGFIWANVAINRGETVQSLDTLRLEQILTIRNWSEEKSPYLTKVSGFRPFLAFVDATNQILAPDRSTQKQWANSIKSDFFSKGNGPNVLLPGAPLLSERAEKVSPPVLAPELSEPVTLPVTLSAAAPSKTSVWMDLTAIGGIGLAQIAIALGLIYIGHCHFNNLFTGISAATFYFLVPYTNQMTGRLDQMIPGALIVWAVGMYRRPLFSGICIGIAGALVYYPIFLVPLWCGFYWKRGMIRFLIGVVSMVVLFYFLLMFSPSEYGSYHDQWLNMLGLNGLFMNTADGLWRFYPSSYRIPLVAVFFVFCLGMLIWPARKNLATLISCSTILMLGTQSWQTYQGGLSMAWYLPLLLLIFFRPNLEDRVATATVIGY